ncbi:MAG: dolichol-phosphate mannosyltransferase [Saprospiraceae bacterium]
MKHLVIIPTYNERENISAIIKAVLQLEFTEVLVVDDGSPDGTAAIVLGMQEDPAIGGRIHIKRRSGKLGLGTAYIVGFNFGLENNYDFINEMDADFSHNPQDLVRLRQACIDGAGMAVGSRYVKGGGTQNWSWFRRFISKGGSYYVKLFTSMPVQDPTAGFICYRKEVLNTIDLTKIEFTGYAFQIEMKYVAYKLGFVIEEVPILFKDRELGVSKMNISIISEAVNGVLKLKKRNVLQYYKRNS